MKKRSTLPKVTLGKSAIHGRGLFAAERIEPGRRIIEYKGERISVKDEERTSKHDHRLTYLFTLNDKYYVDGSLNGNEARFANHSCRGNAYVDIIQSKIWLIAGRNIREGEEITYDYALNAGVLIPCKCGSKKCRGYMNDPEDDETKAILKEDRLKETGGERSRRKTGRVKKIGV